MALGGIPSTYFLPDGQEVSVAQFSAGTSQPRQSVKIVSEGLVIHISRSVNSQFQADNFDVGQFPEVIKQGIQLAEATVGLLQGTNTVDSIETTISTPSAASGLGRGSHGG